MSENTVPIYFSWIMYRPDQREYRQNSIEFNPFVGKESMPVVEVKIPVRHEYLANSEAIIQAQLASDGVPDPILTISGMKFIQDQFDAVLKDSEIVKSDDFKPDIEDEDWGTSTSTTASESTSTDEDWAEADTTVDEPWDESKEDWGE